MIFVATYRLFAALFSLLTNGVNKLINGTPGFLAEQSAAGLTLALACGLWGQVHALAFMNPGLLLCLSYMAVTLITALVKYVRWKQQGLSQPLADGQVLFRLRHLLDANTRFSGYYITRNTTTTLTYLIHPVLLTPPATGCQTEWVVCKVCRSEMLAHIDSLPLRRLKRLLGTIIGVILFLGCLLWEELITLIKLTQPTSSGLHWAWWGILLLFLCSGLGLAYPFRYIGAVIRKVPGEHKILRPGKAEIRQFLSTDLNTSLPPERVQIVRHSR